MPGIGNLNPETLVAGNYAGVTVATGTYGGNPYRCYIQETGGRSGRNTLGIDTAERTFIVRNTFNPLIAREALVEGPAGSDLASYDSLNLSDLQYRRLSRTPDAWEFTASYDNATPNVETGDYVVSIDTTGGQILQTYGYAANTRHNASGETTTNYGNALNVQDGKVQGVERVIPVLKITITARIATEYVVRPMAYAKLCAGLTGFTNSTAMFPYGESSHEFAIGELLFTGVTGTIVAQNPQLNFTFLASENLSGETIGGISGINKKGHQLLWYEFANTKDGTNNRLYPKIVGAHVGTVYGEADLTALKIGTLPT